MKIRHISVIAITLAVGFYNLGMVVLSANERPALIYKETPIRLDHDIYYAGDTVSMVFEYCVLRSSRYTVTQKLQNIDTNEEYYLPSFTVAIARGDAIGGGIEKIDGDDCRRAKGVPKTLPINLPKGRYKFNWTSYSDGRFKNVVEYHYESTLFQVK